MEIDRRMLLLGVTLGSVAGAAPAQACSRVVRTPLDPRWWSGVWMDAVTLPRQERTLANQLVEAVAENSAERLGQLLTPEAELFGPSRGDAVRRLERADAIRELAGYARTAGSRTWTICYFGSVVQHSEFLVHAVLQGYGPPPSGNPYGLCGEDAYRWQRQLVLLYRLHFDRIGDPPRVSRIVSLA